MCDRKIFWACYGRKIMEVHINIEPRDRKELSSNCNCQDQTDRFKGLDLVECLKMYGWRFTICTGGGDQNHPPAKKKNAKMQTSCLRKSYKWLRKEEKQKAKEKRTDILI